MKKFILLIILILIIGVVIFTGIKNKVRSDLTQTVSLPKPTVTPVLSEIVPKNISVSTSVFVPYWTITDTQDVNRFHSFIYFGVVPSTTGIDLNENGALDMKKFLTLVPQTNQRLLTLRMINSTQNISILNNEPLSQAIITDTVSIAQQNHFNGIVLDLEISALPIGQLEQKINAFNKQFYQVAHAQNLTFYQTIEGDTFFRVRPFDIKTLAHYSDGMFIMAYDFSKIDGNPGPNFPLQGKLTYGYDMTQMTDDFLQLVPPHILTVVFGLFGYDWQVDNQGNAISDGQPLTDVQIQQEFLNGCHFTDCTITKDPVSSETTIHYTDQNHQKHIVWFENTDSMHAKEKYLESRGIDSFALWAYSYF